MRKVWSPIGERPLVEVQQRYEWTYLYAFARPNSGKVHWLILPTLRAQAFSIALENFAREVGAGKNKRIVLVVEKAAWHTAKKDLWRCQKGYTWSTYPPTARSSNPQRGCGPFPTRG